jgi:hypothetical protein
MLRRLIGLPLVMACFADEDTMLPLVKWPSIGLPEDDGLVVVVLHPARRATVLVVPSCAGANDVEELDMGMPMALYRAQLEAVRRGFMRIYVACGDEAPWDPAWGEMSG